MRIRGVRSDGGETYVLGDLLPTPGGLHPPPPLRIVAITFTPALMAVPVVRPDGSPVLEELELEGDDDDEKAEGDEPEKVVHGVERTVETPDPDHSRARIAIYAVPDKGSAWDRGQRYPKGRAIRRLIPYPTETGWVDFQGTINEIAREAQAPDDEPRAETAASAAANAPTAPAPPNGGG